MSCPQFREEIELTVGSSEFSPELRDHLASCAECRAYFEEMSELAKFISDESSFALTKSEETQLIERLDLSIRHKSRTEIVSLRWIRYASVAAVLLLSFVGVSGYMRGWFGGTKLGPDSLLTLTVPADTATDTTSAAGLFDEFLSGSGVSGDDLFLSSSAPVLDSISDDEVKYLEANFDAKDVL